MVAGVDIYDAAVKRLQADSRTLGELSIVIGLPPATLGDIKRGETKDLRVSTARKIARHYFPKRVAPIK